MYHQNLIQTSAAGVPWEIVSMSVDILFDALVKPS